jgi:hypothetical protein
MSKVLEIRYNLKDGHFVDILVYQKEPQYLPILGKVEFFEENLTNVIS